MYAVVSTHVYYYYSFCVGCKLLVELLLDFLVLISISANITVFRQTEPEYYVL